MNIYITARGKYAVEFNRYMLKQFTSLKDAMEFIRSAGKIAVFTWSN